MGAYYTFLGFRARLRTGAAIGAGVIASLLASHAARAQQTDVSPPLPNVMLLLDSSGSMEAMADGTDPDANATSKCTLGSTSLPNRWGTAVQALTGEITGPGSTKYSCVSEARTGAAFTNEYGVLGAKPYDYDYYLAYHRPASGTCVVTPGKLPGLSTGLGGAGGSATDFSPTTSITTRDYNTGVAGCTFTQLTDGALDNARDILRFGLMTFDSDPDSGTGVSGSSPIAVNTAAPFSGMWSYYDGWQTGGASPFTGHPINCSTSSLYEVGARNPAAPPWEGRLMPLADPTATISQVEQSNDNIQLVINAMRPYGATPIAGMLQDLKYYYWSDPTGPQPNDPYVQGNCRDEYAILLTDGAPNLDLRPYCTPEGDNPLGHCPYSLPEDIATQLYSGTDGHISGHRVITYVVGFNVNQINDTTPTDCSTLAANPSLFASTCADPSKQSLYGACCTLEKIAFSGSGGTQDAFFVQTQDDLLNALNVIISKIARNTTARTVPAYSPVVATVNNDPNSPITNGSVYLASFQPLVGQTWSGNVTRQRYVCNALQSLTSPTPDATQGDDFAANLNHGAGGPYSVRQFSVIEPTTVAGVTDSSATIRPFETNADGMGTLTGTVTPPTDVASAMTALTPDALSITSTSCPNLNNTEFLTADSCKRLALNFAMGSATTDGMPDSSFRAFTSRAGNAFGDIFHATPTVIGPPNAVIRDGTYEKFAATYAQRPTVLYAATNDGLLHAFNTNVSSQQNNEIWAMMPPAVMPKLLSVYPSGHTLMLDGAPVVKDVVLDRDATSQQAGDSTKWHTMLVAGFGAGAQGYYGVDITDPDARTPVVAGGGPQFRWQLTKVPSSAKQIFGAHSATPAITTVFADLGDGSGAHEIGVAILPGGSDGSPTSSLPCDRDTDTNDAPLSTASTAMPANSAFPARTQVQCWSGNGRSLSVVRLDTGEIIRTFMRTADAPAAVIAANKLRPTPLDSPMTGVPVVYPTDVGAIAQRVYIGDQDGTMWRFDLSSQNPDNWKGELFVDSYNTDPSVVTTTPWKDGQPISVAPTVAIDDVGNVVVAFATGDQETFTATGTNFVYSATEKLSNSGGTTSLRANVNWFLRFTNGQRVSGPMAVFDETLYFATFSAPANTAVCTLGTPELWGRDFEIPKDSTALNLGGIPRFNPLLLSPAPDFYDPTQGSSSSPFAGKIIPGVSINITPTCSDTSTSVNDSYVPGATHYLAQNVTASQPSLFAQVGGQNASGQPLSISVNLPRPATATTVDSWASIVE